MTLNPSFAAPSVGEWRCNISRVDGTDAYEIRMLQGVRDYASEPSYTLNLNPDGELIRVPIGHQYDEFGAEPFLRITGFTLDRVFPALLHALLKEFPRLMPSFVKEKLDAATEETSRVQVEAYETANREQAAVGLNRDLVAMATAQARAVASAANQ